MTKQQLTLADVRWIQRIAEAEGELAREAKMFAYSGVLLRIARRATRIEKRLAADTQQETR